jgi:hypothetical protein
MNIRRSSSKSLLVVIDQLLMTPNELLHRFIRSEFEARHRGAITLHHTTQHQRKSRDKTTGNPCCG